MDFDETRSTPLCEIMGRNRSDKGAADIVNCHHNYTTFYYSLFKDRRDTRLRIFELGIGTNNPNIPSNMGVAGRPGASLYGWSEFFQNSEIFGADIDADILFGADTISTFYCDQTSPTGIASMWGEQPSLQEGFDIIIDDGLNAFHANVCFFENSIHKLNPNGYYFIEDVKGSEIDLFTDKVKDWELEHGDCLFALLQIPSSTNGFDNNILAVSKRGV